METDQGDMGSKEVYAWGNTLNGELGFDSLEEQFDVPKKLDLLKNVKLISSGESHTMFLLEDGSLWSSGANDHGQLGHEKRSRVPERVEGLNDRFIVSVSAGFAHTLAIDKWGTVLAWGSDSHGQLGHQMDDKEDKLVRRPKVIKSLASKIVVQVTAGYFHSLILTNAGEVYSCGSNSHGQLGLGYANSANQNKPCLVELLVGFPIALIAAGAFHSFVLSLSGSVYGWGKNQSGQLGVSETEDKYQPTQLTTLRSLNVRFITAGIEHTAFLTHDGGVFTCGSNSYGQLGHGALTNEILPRKILEFGSPVRQVACGRCHTLCLTYDSNKLYSFGLGQSGQLANDGSNKNSPFHIGSIIYGVESIYAGGDQSFLITGQPDRAHLLHPSCDFKQFQKYKQILTITEDFTNQLTSAVEPVDLELMSHTETLFASPSCWNASFLQSSDESGPCTWKNIGVDLEKAEEILSKLNSIKANSLRNLVDHLVFAELLPKMPHLLKNVEFLKVYVLLPLIPTFYSGSNPMLPLYYAERFQSLPEQLNNVVLRWLYSAPTDQVIRLISVYKKMVVNVIDSNVPISQPQMDNQLRVCLMFLGKLSHFNRGVKRFSYHAFTIPQLSSKIDIRNDYCHWLQQKRQTRKFFFCDFPFVFDAQAKTLLLQTDQLIQMQAAMNKAQSQMHLQFLLSHDPTDMQFLVLNVNRDTIVPDTVNQLFSLNTLDLKKPLKVKFEGEEAEDAGGVKKEFFLLLIKDILDPKYGMFKHDEESRLIWFGGSFDEDRSSLDDYYLIGLICGLAIYNALIIFLPFPLALYKKILEEKVDISDLKELHPSIARSLERVLEYNGSDFTETFCLNFEVTREDYGEVKIVPLKPNGSSIPVTLENKAEFVDLFVAYYLNHSVYKQFDAFKKGFINVCGSTVLKLFHPQELQAMVTGNEDYDWGELERNCSYKGGYSPDEKTIKIFWDVFHSLTLEEKKQFLLFLTGNDRIPILGMKALKMWIQPTGDERYLPVAHTCFNLLDLPKYQTKERLRYKLLQAIQQNQGFSLV